MRLNEKKLAHEDVDFMSDRIVFPEEDDRVSKTVYDQLIKLRASPKDTVVSNLKRFLKSEKSLQVALVLMADDPTQMRIVAHLPTIILEDLRCARLVSSRMTDRMKEASKITINSNISREEFNELSVMVKEMPDLIVQTKQAILVELGNALSLQRKGMESETNHAKGVNSMMSELLSKINSVEELQKSLQANVSYIIQRLTRFISYMVGFARAANYRDPQEELERGVAETIKRSTMR